MRKMKFTTAVTVSLLVSIMPFSNEEWNVEKLNWLTGWETCQIPVHLSHNLIQSMFEYQTQFHFGHILLL